MIGYDFNEVGLMTQKSRKRWKLGLIVLLFLMAVTLFFSLLVHSQPTTNERAAQITEGESLSNVISMWGEPDMTVHGGPENGMRCWYFWDGHIYVKFVDDQIEYKRAWPTDNTLRWTWTRLLWKLGF